MDKHLKSLDDTIADIEKEIKKNPHPFLISTLERLKIYRDKSLENVVEKIETENIEKKRTAMSSFRGYGVS